MPVMGVKIGEYILVAFDFEIFAANFVSNDFLIAQGRRETAAPHPVLFFDNSILLADNQKNSNNEFVSVH